MHREHRTEDWGNCPQFQLDIDCLEKSNNKLLPLHFIMFIKFFLQKGISLLHPLCELNSN
jgi:hypothetical protein